MPHLFIDINPRLFNRFNNCVNRYHNQCRSQIIHYIELIWASLCNFSLLTILYCLLSDIFEVEKKAYLYVPCIFLCPEETIILPFFNDLSGTSIHKCERKHIILVRRPTASLELWRQHYLCCVRDIRLYCHLFHSTTSDEQESSILGLAEDSDDD